jgi:opacity protein-like surface antigen
LKLPSIEILAAVPIVAREMKFFSAGILGLALAIQSAFAGGGDFTSATSIAPLDPPRFELALQSAYLLGVLGNPNSYEIAPQFLTGRVRWGVNNSDSWTRGYHQFSVTLMAEPIVRGIENHYFGVNFGGRYNFVRPNSRIMPYLSGGLGLGWIDSNPDMRGSQGQDFTFNILTGAGIGYQVDDHWKIDIGVLYEHLSNGGQTDPNPSLNLFGPQVGASYSF